MKQYSIQRGIMNKFFFLPFLIMSSGPLYSMHAVPVNLLIPNNNPGVNIPLQAKSLYNLETFCKEVITQFQALNRFLAQGQRPPVDLVGKYYAALELLGNEYHNDYDYILSTPDRLKPKYDIEARLLKVAQVIAYLNNRQN